MPACPVARRNAWRGVCKTLTAVALRRCWCRSPPAPSPWRRPSPSMSSAAARACSRFSFKLINSPVVQGGVPGGRRGQPRRLRGAGDHCEEAGAQRRPSAPCRRWPPWHVSCVSLLVYTHACRVHKTMRFLICFFCRQLLDKFPAEVTGGRARSSQESEPGGDCDGVRPCPGGTALREGQGRLPNQWCACVLIRIPTMNQEKLCSNLESRSTKIISHRPVSHISCIIISFSFEQYYYIINGRRCGRR